MYAYLSSPPPVPSAGNIDPLVCPGAAQEGGDGGERKHDHGRLWQHAQQGKAAAEKGPHSSLTTKPKDDNLFAVFISFLYLLLRVYFNLAYPFVLLLSFLSFS